MQQYIDFVLHHWLLWLALVMVAALIFFEETRTKMRGVQRVSPQDAISLINHQEALIIDIRDQDAFTNAHIVGAMNIPSDKLEDKLQQLNKYKAKPIILVCYKGISSVEAGTKLHKQGFEKIYSLAGGIGAWQNAGLPLTKF